MDPALPTTPIALWRSDAVVLYDWLMSVDLGSVPVTHPAERQALMDLLTRLEETDVMGVTQEEIDEAREAVAPESDWQPWQQSGAAAMPDPRRGRPVSYRAGDRVRYVAEPVFDLLVKPGDTGVVIQVDAGWVVVEWPESGEHSVPLASVRPEQAQ
jgi:hypothetical protein